MLTRKLTNNKDTFCSDFSATLHTCNTNTKDGIHYAGNFSGNSETTVGAIKHGGLTTVSVHQGVKADTDGKAKSFKKVMNLLVSTFNLQISNKVSECPK